MTNSLLITGDNVHVFKYIGITPFEVVCATGMELVKEMELIGATTPESGTSPEVRPRLETTSLTLTGATTSTNDGDVSVFYLSDRTRELHDLLIVYTDNAGSQVTYRQDFYIERLAVNGNSGESSQYDILLRGTGPYTETELADPVDEGSGDTVTSGTFTIASGVVQDNSLIGVTIIEVCREGTELTSMQLLVPYTYNSLTGTITPDPDTTIDGQKLFVIWRY
jgi:hypothetical protein